MRILISCLLLALPLAAQTLQVTKGAAEYQVYQRGPGNSATIRVEGSAQGAAGRTVEARLVAAGRPVNHLDWQAAGKVTANGFTAVLSNVPTGGPYSLELRAGGPVTTVANLLVGDLWLLAGQSNMEGVGNLVNTPLPSAEVNSLDMTDIWVTASDPLHRLPDANDRVHWRRNAQGQAVKLEGEALANWIANRKKGAGPGLPFALEMVKRTGVPIGLIPCAHGGTSMDQWDPALKDKGGDSLYGGMVRRFELAGGKIKGLLWYQGESDASPTAAPLFEAKFRNLVAAIRKDFHQPELPFYYVQIGRHTSLTNQKEWDLIQAVQLKVESEIPNVGMVTCVDCELDDGIHVSTTEQPLLGHRLANLATGETRKGPRPVSARARDGIIRVDFAEVNGRLVHAGRLYGFGVYDASGAYVPAIYKQRVSAGDPSVVELLYGGKLPEGAVLYYGEGRDPYVNLRDEAGMAAPAFGPMAISQ